jgi:hypothetical protein
MTAMLAGGGGRWRHPAAASYYICASVLLTSTVKALFAAAEAALPVPLLLLSQAAAVLALFALSAAARLWTAPALPRGAAQWRVYLPLLLAYVAMLTSSVVALQLTSLLMYHALRRTSLAFVVAAQAAADGARPTRCTAAAAAMTVAGAVYAGFYDLGFHARGYGLAVAANAASAVYLVRLRPVRDKLGYTNAQFLFVNTLFVAPLLAVFLATAPAGAAARFISVLRGDVRVAGLFVAACVLTFFLNHSTYVNTSVNDAVVQTVSAQVKDLVLLGVSFVVFDRAEHRAPGNVAGVLFGFAGSLVYGYGRLLEAWREGGGGAAEGADAVEDAHAPRKYAQLASSSDGEEEEDGEGEGA